MIVAVDRARPRPPDRWVERTAGAWASIVPQVLQRGHRPAHLTDSVPHPLHRKPPDAAREDVPDAFGRGTGGRDDMARTVSGRSDNHHGAVAERPCQAADDVSRPTSAGPASPAVTEQCWPVADRVSSGCRTISRWRRPGASCRRSGYWSRKRERKRSDCWSPIARTASGVMSLAVRTLPERVVPPGRRG